MKKAFLKTSLGHLLIFVATFPGIVLADQIIMNNGDIITGKLVRVDKNEITIDPSYTGKFAVNASAVVSIVTDDHLELELENGEVMDARFAGVQEDRQILIVGEDRVPVELNQLKEAARPQPYYQRESKTEGLLTINEGNTVNRNATFKLDTRLRLGDHRHYAVLMMKRDENNNVNTKKQDLFRHEYDWLFSNEWYLGSTATFERDPIRDLEHRFTFGSLLGRDIFDSEQGALTIKTGIGYTDEKLGDLPANGPVGLWELDFRQDLRGGDIEFFHDHALTYQHYGNNNLIVNTATGLRMDIMWDIYATASYRFNYESEPAPTKLNKDSTLGFGLGARF